MDTFYQLTDNRSREGTARGTNHSKQNTSLAGGTNPTVSFLPHARPPSLTIPESGWLTQIDSSCARPFASSCLALRSAAANALTADL